MIEAFNNEVELKLNELDCDRLKAIYWLKISIGIFVLFSSLTVISAPDSVGILLIMTIALSRVYILFNRHWGEYKRKYKEFLISRLTASINDLFNYDPHKIISDDEFEKSKLFSKPYTYFKRGDFFSGSIGQIPVEFSEVNTISLQSGHYESSRSINKTVFNGIFFKVDVDNFFERALFVCPNESRLDRYFGLPKKINDEYMRKYVSLESPDFSEYFNVFCNDKSVVPDLLPVAVMEHLVYMRRSLGSDIRLAFVGSNIMITVSKEKSYSEPKLFKPAISLEQASELHIIIIGNIKLVTELIESFSLSCETAGSL